MEHVRDPATAGCDSQLGGEELRTDQLLRCGPTLSERDLDDLLASLADQSLLKTLANTPVSSDRPSAKPMLCLV